jgi:histone H3/H4
MGVNAGHHEVIRKFGGNMAARKKRKTGGARKTTGDLIISKARTKAATKKCNVGGEFYGALDKVVRKLIADAEARAIGNKRKTLKAVDL